MAKWKLSRLIFGNEEFYFSEGDEVTIGRGTSNKIMLSSLLISRNHCVLRAQKDEVFLTDLKSSNGIFVGNNRIPSNTPTKLKACDVIGFGLTTDSSFPNVENNEKYLFKLIREETTLADRIVFQPDDIEYELLALENGSKARVASPIIDLKQNLKRKIDQEKENILIKTEFREKQFNANTDCDIETNIKNNPSDLKTSTHKKKKLDLKNDPISSEEVNPLLKENALELEAFSIKNEYLGEYDEPIQIDSDSDSESEQWRIRLSQNSPGKPFTKLSIKSHSDAAKDSKNEDSSYSQIDDGLQNIHNSEENEGDDYMFDLISIPPQPPEYCDEIDNNQEHLPHNESHINELENVQMISADTSNKQIKQPPVNENESNIINKNKASSTSTYQINEDHIDGVFAEIGQTKEVIPEPHIKSAANKIPLISAQPFSSAPRKIQKPVSPECKPKTATRRNRKTSSAKITITNSQKEERKRKLKAIAEKNREQIDQSNTSVTKIDDSKKANPINVKVTNSNRTMRMAQNPPEIQKDNKSKTESTIKKSVDTKSESKKDKSKDKVIMSESKSKNEEESNKVKQIKSKSKKTVEIEKVPHVEISNKTSKHKSKHELLKDKPVKSLMVLTDSEDTLIGKPASIGDSLPKSKPKKSVRFSEAPPQVREFDIEPGNRMRKTSMIKTTLVDVQNMPRFSLEKLTLIKILRWNPQWFDEQVNNHEPPPILGHNNAPTTLFHTFQNHNLYVQQVGDLLLMEIWESLSIAYSKVRNQPNFLSMRIASLPPVPPPERCFDLFNISVDISLPNTEIKNLPKVGNILLVSFGSEATRRFFHVHNVKWVPSPPRNIHSFYNLSLHATFTQKMKDMKPGEVITAVNLSYINNEMNLFEAMEYLACSPLSEAILRPEPRHFAPYECYLRTAQSQWTMTLNESQQRAVTSSVAAALGDKPCIQMIQGPPGTGKSSVICSIVMSYFYDEHGKRHQNRGKILICATSNAAVDGLVLKLLKIRQDLPKPQRFRMVRVGRVEAMHERARDLSSQQLAQRDVQRAPAAAAGSAQEISLLNAKINKWKTTARDAKDPARVAYCESRVNDLEKRKALLTGGGAAPGEAVRPEQLLQAERRIVDCADIIATTLASVHNHKMRGLKRRIALCIVDEAGQAIEPEALLPLTLDVTRLTLVGDPQQLPGYICSQRAKSLGLGESLFSRLSSLTETWQQPPTQLLQVQYRMHAHIADYPNRAFYDARVRDSPPPRPALPAAPYLVLGIASGDKGQAARGDNALEAWGAARVAAALRGAGARSLAVITPYQAQRDDIKRKLRMLESSESETGSVEVTTVDSFQGQERDVVVVSLARSHGLGFVAEPGRMAVLLTRARHVLVVCLNPRAVQNNPQWRTLLEDAQRRKLYRSLPNSICQATGPISDDDVLSYLSVLHHSDR